MTIEKCPNITLIFHDQDIKSFWLSNTYPTHSYNSHTTTLRITWITWSHSDIDYKSSVSESFIWSLFNSIAQGLSPELNEHKWQVLLPTVNEYIGIKMKECRSLIIIRNKIGKRSFNSSHRISSIIAAIERPLAKFETITFDVKYFGNI